MYLKSLNEFKSYIEKLQIKSQEQLMILIGEKSVKYLYVLSDYLNSKDVKFFGGIYPRLLVKNQCISEGFIVQKYEPMYVSMIIPYMMRFKLELSENEDYTAIVLADGLSSKIKHLTDTVYNKIGNKVTYIGGGAGYYDLQHRPCLFDNKGVYKDALFICIIKSSVKLAVEHGWNVLDGPFSVTESQDNILFKVDNYNAFDVYRDVIQEEEGVRLYKEDFFVYAKDYPFGFVEKNEDDIIVRDPIALNEEREIVCVANIPEGSELYVLHGNKESLLNSSMEIVKYCMGNVSSEYVPLLFDCISRAMFLEESFEQELVNIQNKLEYPVEGALSIGEFASKKNGGLIIHNKSTILGLLEKN